MDAVARRVVVAGEAVAVVQGVGGGEEVESDDAVEPACELGCSLAGKGGLATPVKSENAHYWKLAN